MFLIQEDSCSSCNKDKGGYFHYKLAFIKYKKGRVKRRIKWVYVRTPRSRRL